jgi:hypothetical protein
MEERERDSWTGRQKDRGIERETQILRQREEINKEKERLPTSVSPSAHTSVSLFLCSCFSCKKKNNRLNYTYIHMNLHQDASVKEVYMKHHNKQGKPL